MQTQPPASGESSRREGQTGDGRAPARTSEIPAMVTDGGSEPPEGTDDDASGTGDVGAGAGSPLEDLLVSAGILEEEPGSSDLRLTHDFEQAWQERIRQMRGGDRALRWLAATHDVDADDLTVSEREGRYAVELDGVPIETWPSEASFLAGLVAEPTLREWLPDARWEELTDEVREGLVAQIMLFLEQCPACDGTLELTEEESDGSLRILLDCPDCGTTILEGTY